MAIVRKKIHLNRVIISLFSVEATKNRFQASIKVRNDLNLTEKIQTFVVSTKTTIVFRSRKYNPKPWCGSCYRRCGRSCLIWS